jgi:hypothetical protein
MGLERLSEISCSLGRLTMKLAVVVRAESIHLDPESLVFQCVGVLIDSLVSTMGKKRKRSKTTLMPNAPAEISSSHIELLRAAYAAFNARDIDAALALMTPDVAWPCAFKGGFVRGPEEVRAYWTEQWSEINPHVEPFSFHAEDAGRILVEVHQIVRDLAGTLLADDRVGHRFSVEKGLIQGMEVCSLP